MLRILVGVLRSRDFSGSFIAASPPQLSNEFLRYVKHICMTYISTEIRQLILSWFLVVDGGVQVHVLLTLIMLPHVHDGGQRLINWGGERSR